MNLQEDFLIEEINDKYAWFQILDLAFTAPHYLKSFLHSYLGPDETRDIIWINKSSSHLYDTRWHPEFCFIYIPEREADNIDLALRQSKIGYLAMNHRNTFQKFTRDYINKLVKSPFYPDLIGKVVDIIHGPLEDFIGTVNSYSDNLSKYILRVQLLVSYVDYPHHLNEFTPHEDTAENNIL